MIDRVGFEITANTYTDKDKVEQHKASVLARNAEIAKQNKAVDDEVARLRKLLQDKTLQLAKCDDADKKAALQAEVDQLKGQVAETESKRQPLVVIIGPTKFSKPEEAEAYVEQVKQAAGKAKAKAETAPHAK